MSGARTGRNFLWLITGQVTSRLLAFGTTVYLTRVLEPDGFGAVVTALAVLAYAAVLVDLGFDGLGPLEVARAELSPGQLAGSVVALRLLATLPAMSAVAAVAALAPLGDSARWVIALYGASLLTNAVALNWAFLGTTRMNAVSEAEILHQAAFAAGVVACVRAPEHLLRVPAVYLAARLAMVAWLALRGRGLLRGFTLRPDRTALARLWPANLAFAGSAALAALLQQFDAALLGLRVGTAAAATYGAAVRVVWVPTLLATALLTALRPGVVRALRGGGEQAILHPTLRLAAALGAGTAVLGIALADPVVRLLYGDGYLTSALPLRVLCAAFGCLAVSRVYRLLLVAAGRQATDLRILGAAAGSNAVLNLLLVPRMGPPGAALAALAAEALILVLARAATAELAAGPSLTRLLSGPLACALATTAALSGLGALPLLPRIAVAALLYLALLWGTKLVGPRDLKALVDA